MSLYVSMPNLNCELKPVTSASNLLQSENNIICSWTKVLLLSSPENQLKINGTLFCLFVHLFSPEIIESYF